MNAQAPEPASGSLTAWIGMGSNMGDSPAVLEKALRAVNRLRGVRVAVASSVYFTEPQDYTDQPFFTNRIAALECSASVHPEYLLHELLRIEDELGRVRDPAQRFGSRTVDLDLLLFGERCMKTEILELPHPRMTRRAFVLVPLADTAPNFVFPDGTSVRKALGGIDFFRFRNFIFQK